MELNSVMQLQLQKKIVQIRDIVEQLSNRLGCG